MPNRFYKAFNQFSKDVDTTDIKTFQQLLYQITEWGIDANGRHHINLDSKKQVKAIAREGKDRLGLLCVMRKEYSRKSSKGKEYTQVIYRDINTGKFSTRSEYEDTIEYGE